MIITQIHTQECLCMSSKTWTKFVFLQGLCLRLKDNPKKRQMKK